MSFRLTLKFRNEALERSNVHLKRQNDKVAELMGTVATLTKKLEAKDSAKASQELEMEELEGRLAEREAELANFPQRQAENMEAVWGDQAEVGISETSEESSIVVASQCPPEFGEFRKLLEAQKSLTDRALTEKDGLISILEGLTVQLETINLRTHEVIDRKDVKIQALQRELGELRHTTVQVPCAQHNVNVGTWVAASPVFPAHDGLGSCDNVSARGGASVHSPSIQVSSVHHAPQIYLAPSEFTEDVSGEVVSVCGSAALLSSHNENDDNAENDTDDNGVAIGELERTLRNAQQRLDQVVKRRKLKTRIARIALELRPKPARRQPRATKQPRARKQKDSLGRLHCPHCNRTFARNDLKHWNYHLKEHRQESSCATNQSADTS